MLKSANSPNPHYKLIEAAIWHIHQNAGRETSLSALAQKFRVSQFHFQKLFKRWAGVTPKQYVQYLKLQVAKRNVKSGRSLLSAGIRSGLSSPGRLHDLFVNLEAMTPAEYREMGKGMEIFYGFHETRFGPCLVGVSPRGVCFLNFLDGESERVALKNQKANWKNALFKMDPICTGEIVNRIFGEVRKGKEKGTGKEGEKPVTLLVKGTNFQIKVWEALLKIDSGSISSYKHLAQAIRQPGSARAVGSACGKNDLAFVIPCHRVLTSGGELGGYRWGEKRKLAILQWEDLGRVGKNGEARKS